MNLTKNAQEYHEKMFPGYESKFLETDPEFIERFDNFAFDEVVNEPGIELDQKTRMISVLSVLLGCQGIDEFRAMLPAAMNFGVTPVEVKEIVYQAVDYLGIGRVFPFLKAVNEVLTEKGISIPLGRTGSDHDGGPPRKRNPDPGGYFRRPHERVLQIRPGRIETYQPLARRKLLRRLLHQNRSRL